MWLKNKTYGFIEKLPLLIDRVAAREEGGPRWTMRRQKIKLRESRFDKWKRGMFAYKRWMRKFK